LLGRGYSLENRLEIEDKQWERLVKMDRQCKAWAHLIFDRTAVYRTVRTVVVCCGSCIEDGGRPSGRGWSGRPVKQPSAAVDKSYGSEQRRKSPEELDM
jgi:hypothetical protein